MPIKLVMPSNHLILCYPLLLPPSIFPSIRVFYNESVLHIRWPTYWSFSNTSPSNEQSGQISFRMDWLDLLAVQGTLKSLLQHHSSKVWTYANTSDNITTIKITDFSVTSQDALMVPLCLSFVLNLCVCVKNLTFYFAMLFIFPWVLVSFHSLNSTKLRS